MRKCKKTLILIILILFPTYLYSYSKSKILDGITIVLDAGHGGKDQGASSNNVYEAPLNLEITKKLQSQLLSLGANVIMTRNDENDLSSLSSTNKKKDDMKKRLQIINDEKNDLFISIHMNIYEDSSVHGIHVFYKDDSIGSYNFGQIIQNEMNQSMNQKKSAKVGYFYLLENARVVSILVECGFLSNEKERNELLDSHHQQKIVDSIVRGILEYYKEYI